MKNVFIAAAVLLAVFAGCAGAPETLQTPKTDAREQVRNVERAFAKTMADRDHAAFTTFVSGEAIFFSGPAPLHGKQQVCEWWKRFYKTSDAPFSWEPETIEVLDSGTLALSSGPVRNAKGKLIATFTSIWRLESPGV